MYLAPLRFGLASWASIGRKKFILFIGVMCALCNCMKRVVNYDDACTWVTIFNDHLNEMYMVNIVVWTGTNCASMRKKSNTALCTWFQIIIIIYNEVEWREVNRVFAQFEQRMSAKNKLKTRRRANVFSHSFICFVTIQIDCNNVFVQFITRLWIICLNVFGTWCCSHGTTQVLSIQRVTMMWSGEKMTNKWCHVLSHTRTMNYLWHCTSLPWCSEGSMECSECHFSRFLLFGLLS